jgi:hypothetical protein
MRTESLGMLSQGLWTCVCPSLTSPPAARRSLAVPDWPAAHSGTFPKGHTGFTVLWIQAGIAAASGVILSKTDQ